MDRSPRDFERERLVQWTYVLFVVIAIVAGLAIGYMAYTAHLHWSDSGVANANGWITLIMAILGVIIGITSTFISGMTAKEVPIRSFLLATIALIVAASANVWFPLGKIHDVLYYMATGILNYIVAFAAPAAVLISVRAILAVAKER